MMTDHSRDFHLINWRLSDIKHLASVVAELKPVLVVIDTLRSFDANAEKDNPTAGLFIKPLRTMGNSSKTAFFLRHQVKKQDSGFLQAPKHRGCSRDPVAQSVLRRAGLINQTYVR